VVGRVRQLAVISPYCDDAVFACGRMLEAHPGSIVVTVCAGRPAADIPLTEWDRAADFRAGDDVMGMRREEDRAALALLAAYPVWLNFWR
jgi:LmbE family N-acetylglucosaminyl deacetylase